MTSRTRGTTKDSELEDLNFLKAFAINDVSTNISLEQQERAANALVREALHKSKIYQAEHDYTLPDHLEKFRLEYEKRDKKIVSIPLVSQLSPRTKRELSLMPAPTQYEEQKIQKLVNMASKKDARNLYNTLAPKHAAEDLPRFSAIANSKMVLIPNNAARDVGKDSVNYFETMENAKKRKQDQDARLAALFDKYKDSPSDTAAKAHKSTPKSPKSPSQSQHPNKKAHHVPKLSAPSQAAAHLIMNNNTGPSGDAGPSASTHELTPSVSAKTKETPPRSSSMKVGAINLSKSLSSLAIPDTGSSKLNNMAVIGRPGTTNTKPLAPINASKVGYNKLAANDAETLEAESTPLLYSMFKSNPVAERGVRYSPTAMTNILEQRYSAENERLQRITAKLKQKSEQEYLNLFSVQVLEECGLDLNKEYNKIRNYTLYLMQLSYHFYIQRIRAGFTHLHSQFLKIRAARIKKASEVIFKTVKLGIYVLTSNERKRRKEQQSATEAQRLREIEERYNRSCKTIYRCMFYYTQMKKIRRMLRQRRAATVIQRRARGVIGRRRAAAWKKLHAFLSSRALMIECAYRCHLARRKVNLARKLQFVRRWLDDLRDFRARRLKAMTQDGAEIYIARAYRTLVFRRKLKNLLYWNRFNSALLIQRIYKGYCVRKKFHKVWSLHKKKVATETQAAILIQKMVRCHFARRRFYQLAAKKNKATQERRQRKLLQLATAHQHSLMWKMVLLYRKTKLFRIDMLNRKATIVQKVWRGTHGRKRAFIVKVTKAIDAINKKHRHRMKSAARIQRNWRGFITRLKLLRKKKIKMALRIQTVFRLVRAKWRVKALKLLHARSRTLTKKLHRLCKRHKFHLKYMWQQARAPSAIKIQSLFRRALAVRRVCKILSERRAVQETALFILTRLNQLLAATQLQLIRDTLPVEIGTKSWAFSGHSCICLGPVQAIFTLAACNKGRTDPTALITNKADSITLIRLLSKVQGVLEPTADQGNKDKGKKKHKKHAIATNLCLLQEYDAGRISLPSVARRLKNNQIDILFNRAKTETGNVLSYNDFLECLKLVAAAHYAKFEIPEALETSEEAAAGGATTSATAVATVNSATVASTIAAATTETAATVHSHLSSAQAHKAEHAAHHFHQAGHKRRVHNLSLARLRCNPKDLFFGTDPDFRLALVLNTIASLRHEEWMTQILEWMDKESRARIDVFVTRIQSIVRRHQAKKISFVRAAAREEDRRNLRLWKHATRVQSMARMFVQRFRLARKAQKTIVQYNPHFGDPYWYNPNTKVKSWTKPKVLRNLDAYSIALPEEGLENVINCSYCSRTAEVNCCECEDSMCRVCYDSMHCKGARLKHRSMKIPTCSYCKFQVATKSCLTCIITEPPRGTIRESVNEADRGLYCDTCFIHEHDSNEKALSLHKQRRKGLKNILAYSTQAYLIDQYLHQKIITSHYFEDMVQSCEECCTRSSTWRCQDCNQVYCSSCLVGLHSMGGPFARHKAEQLPYFTPDMHVSFKEDITKQLFQQKMEKLNKVEKARREEHQRHSAIKLQSWWRMIMYGHLGRREMKRRRRRLRSAGRAYKRDTLQSRNTPHYKMLDLFGLAPHLPTDTVEQNVLRELNIFQKYAAREFINENKEDWGYFRVSRTIPRKGVPKRGFHWGTLEELEEQAVKGGYRLPGRVLVVPGEQIFNTTCDLTNIVKPGEYVRIRSRIFGVVRVTSAQIRVNRFWRAGDSAAKPDEEGELMYRAPLYKDEPRKAEYRRRYLAYALAVENPITQAGFAIYRAYCARMMRFSLYMVRTNRRNGMKEEEQTWRAASVHYADEVRRVDSLYSTGDSLTSLYNTERIRPKERALEEDLLSMSVKKKLKKGLLETMKEKQELEDLLDKDNSGSNDSWGEPSATVRPKSALKKTGSARTGRVVPSDVDSSWDGGSAKYSEGEDTIGFVEDGASQKLEDGSVGSSRSKSSMLSRISNKFFNKEEADAVKAAADALHEAQKVDLPKAADMAQVMAQLAEKKKNKKSKLDKPAEPWYATADQLDARNEREDKMTPQELAAEADDWKECVDIMTENIYYQNVKTNELFSTVPRAVAAKRQLEFENSKNKKNYDEAQKRIQKLENILKNRKLITGGRHK